MMNISRLGLGRCCTFRRMADQSDFLRRHQHASRQYRACRAALSAGYSTPIGSGLAGSMVARRSKIKTCEAIKKEASAGDADDASRR